MKHAYNTKKVEKFSVLSSYDYESWEAGGQEWGGIFEEIQLEISQI